MAEQRIGVVGGGILGVAIAREVVRRRPGARVVSPCGGKVVFGSSFRSYGLLLIVDCGDGYHFVLAGLDRLDAAPGQRVLAGEPVGQLGASENNARVPLYLELRRKGQPVDPRSWFGARG